MQLEVFSHLDANLTSQIPPPEGYSRELNQVDLFLSPWTEGYFLIRFYGIQSSEIEDKPSTHVAVLIEMDPVTGITRLRKEEIMISQRSSITRKARLRMKRILDQKRVPQCEMVIQQA